MFKEQVTDRFMQVVGLFENTLGRYADKVAYNQDKEQIKKVLAEVYGYKNIFYFVEPELDDESVDRFFRTLFTYYEHKEIGQQTK